MNQAERDDDAYERWKDTPEGSRMIDIRINARLFRMQRKTSQDYRIRAHFYESLGYSKCAQRSRYMMRDAELRARHSLEQLRELREVAA